MVFKTFRPFFPTIEKTASFYAPYVTHAAIFDGEEYDARIPLGYETPEKLSTPEVNNEFKGEIFPSDGAEVYFRQDLSLAPVNAYIWESVEGKNENDFGKIVIKRKYNAGEPMEINPGENLVIDFGQNTAAVPSFIFSAAEGTVLNCVTSELLNDGNGAKDRGMDGLKEVSIVLILGFQIQG